MPLVFSSQIALCRSGAIKIKPLRGFFWYKTGDHIRRFVVGKIFFLVMGGTWSVSSPCQLRVRSVSPPSGVGVNTDHTRTIHGGSPYRQRLSTRGEEHASLHCGGRPGKLLIDRPERAKAIIELITRLMNLGGTTCYAVEIQIGSAIVAIDRTLITHHTCGKRNGIPQKINIASSCCLRCGG